jgi:hypothetical protein
MSQDGIIGLDDVSENFLGVWEFWNEIEPESEAETVGYIDADGKDQRRYQWAVVPLTRDIAVQHLYRVYNSTSYRSQFTLRVRLTVDLTCIRIESGLVQQMLR